jgi:diadenosine tetraphosphate (Ap4A) HIT family hydrolase
MAIYGEKMETKVYEDKYFVVVSLKYTLNCREDGGHLIIGKKMPVTDCSDMNYKETIDFIQVSTIVGKAMNKILGVERMNCEDLANWGLDDPKEPKMRLHFFGRARK